MDSINRAAVDAKGRDIDRLMETPVKQYMRRHVWLPVAQRRRCQLGRPINYFTLTTPALHDVNLLLDAGLVERTPRGFPNIGFCEFDERRYVLIANQLRRCRWSHRGPFEQMVLEDENFESTFNFDVINLDFIAVPFPDGESPLEGTWGAIEKLLYAQWKQAVGFDLLMTFRGSIDRTDGDALDRVARLLQQNLEGGRGIVEFESRVGHGDPILLMNEDYTTFLSLGLPKLLASKALEIGFEVGGHDVYKYQREGSDGMYHIIKFVMSLEIPQQSSASSFAALPPAVARYDAIVPQIFSKPTVDVDCVLAREPYILKEMEEEIQRLTQS